MKVKKLALVSLSSGILGEAFISHELELGLKRLASYGIEVVMMSHALKGISYLQAHPEKRAQDLIDAFADDSIDMILCAIGGDDTYRLLPYLFEEDRLQKVVQQKIFLGFSDATINHLMLHQLGLKTFYGQSFLTDICELGPEMLAYSRTYLEELLKTGRISQVRPSPIWYQERTDFSPAALGTELPAYSNGGFELLKGPACFKGKILGGCLESLYDLLDNSRFADSVSLGQAYGLFPPLTDWQDRILLLETSEEKPSPDLYRQMIRKLKATGIFSVLVGVLVGKPQDEMYDSAYKTILLEELKDEAIAIVSNLNVGHANPRAILPFGVEALVDTRRQIIQFNYGEEG